MTASSIDSSSSSNVAALQSKMQQAKVNFDKLVQSLQSGNLAGAQQAFAALQQNAPQGQTNPLQKRIDALGQALQSGNLAAAQQALSALQSAGQALGSQGGRGSGAGGGGGGGSGGAGGSSSSSKTEVSATSTTSASGVITTVITYSDGSQATTTNLWSGAEFFAKRCRLTSVRTLPPRRCAARWWRRACRTGRRR